MKKFICFIQDSPMKIYLLKKPTYLTSQASIHCKYLQITEDEYFLLFSETIEILTNAERKSSKETDHFDGDVLTKLGSNKGRKKLFFVTFYNKSSKITYKFRICSEKKIIV